MALADTSSDIFSGPWFRTEGLRILIVLAIAVGVSVAARFAVRRLEKRVAAGQGDTSEVSLRRVATVTHSLLNTTLAIIWVITTLVVLGQFGVSLGPLVAGAGIAGVALGFGAQTLVRDGLSGLFILLENQFDLGDQIDALTTAGSIVGRVEGFTLRVSMVRAYDGTLHYIPNGNIQVVSNKSRGWARAIVDARIRPDEDVERVRGILDQLFDELRDEEPFGETLKAGPDLLGVQGVTADALVLRVVAETMPPNRFEIERLLRERISARFAERGVRVPVVAQAAPKPDAAAPGSA